MREEVIETDVLCIGGGIVGLMAAIRASDSGAKVIVAEKGNTLRSGCGATGNDHFLCYIPEIHGQDVEVFLKTLNTLQMREQLAVVGKGLARMIAEKSFEIVKLWDRWGIPMKFEGGWHFAGHAYPGQPRIFLKYAGRDQKRVLTEQALQRGVRIVNRVMVCDLLGGENGVTGAVGVSTREDILVRFNAKTVILGTGRAGRLYPGLTPGWIFNEPQANTLTGDGRGMAYRIGAELANLEILKSHAGPKYFSRYGQATWVGVLRDPEGKPIGPFVAEPDARYGDIMTEVDKDIFAHYSRTGKGPVYMDSSGCSDSDYEYMLHWMRNEGNGALVTYMEEEGVDNRKNPLEFASYPTPRVGRIVMNEKGETSVKGLYTGGDEAIGGMAQAAVSGWVAGENAATYAREAFVPEAKSIHGKMDEVKDLIGGMRSREQGPGWKELNIALQQIMVDYAGPLKSATMLEAGLRHLRRLRGKARGTLKAGNPHEVSRSMEVFNLLDLGELVLMAAMDRKESRGSHVRSDCPYTNPLWNEKLHVMRRVDGKAVFEWREKRN